MPRRDLSAADALDDPDRPVCPFCRAPAPGEGRCPAHDLPLVFPDELPASVTADGSEEARAGASADAAPLPIHDLSGGRGLLLLSALLLLFGPLLPFADLGVERVVIRSGVEVAGSHAPGLWAVPAVGVWLMLVFQRRRSFRALRRARLAVPLLGLLAGASLGHAFWHLRRLAGALADRFGVEVASTPLVGVWVMGAGVLLTLVVPAFLGRSPPEPPLRRPAHSPS